MSAPKRSMVYAKAKYPWFKLRVGQTFFVPGRTASQLHSAKTNAEKRLGFTFELRSVTRENESGTLVRRLS